MQLKDKLISLRDDLFGAGDFLIEAYYAEHGLEVVWLDMYDYEVRQVDSKFEDGYAPAENHSNADINAWALRKLIDTITGGA